MPRSKLDPMRGFESPRDFFGAVTNAYAKGKVDERLRPLQAAGSDEQSTQQDPYGGFMVPEAMSPNMLSTFEGDPIGSRVTRIPMDSPILKIPARADKNHSTAPTGGLTAGRRLETAEIASSRLEMELIRLEAKNYFGLSFATEQLLMDSPASVAALLEAGFQDTFLDQIIHERLFGTGVGEFMGVMNSPCLISVAKESGQSGDTINAQNVIKMRNRCWHYDRAVWLANPNTYSQLAVLMVESTTPAGVVALYHHSEDETKPDTLAGRPIFYSEYCKTLGDLGDLVCGNWSQYLEGTYQTGKAESTHVRYLNHERGFKFWLRNDGAPWWKSAVTPKNGAETLSPFVALAERA